ncbi:TIGR04282 family arsenosugar biosynthesis glycosyltransferase [Desulfosporosinus nitroreducens]|uniref:DUF2064 domain-containing protein n=1 Tax=Desulfosporosinus nitroreducens TaxID=2018668 RepID=A0ABT8QUB9_9FIRM|nr:DUF2064 domain-containing protein [Desulfosporosinus nitroreducens]MDO0824962.1 DUF2064 domain-containing protein [Desulfosporosinus nitroreducens]
MKKAIIVFTKVPKVGVCKTRLTEARGGILTPEEANAFYEACILDVIDVCLSVEEEDIWICYNQDGDRSYLDSILTQVKYPLRIAGVFSDQGGSFDDCMQYATDFILKSGSDGRLADAVLISGGDLPTLQPYILREALNKLEKLSLTESGQKGAIREVRGSDGMLIGASLVEAACQEGGFSLVGLTCTTNFNFNDVFYNLEGITALDMLVTKAAKDEIPFGYVEMVPDVDIPVDLASQLPVLQGIALAAKNDPEVIVPQRTISLLDELGLKSHALPPVRETV